MVNLDLRRDLPKIRAAYDAGQLQRQKTLKGQATYDGPCAVGVCLTPEQQTQFENNAPYSILNKFNAGQVTCPEGQRDDWIRLQVTHDDFIHEFGELLTGLEVKYGQP